MDSHRLLKGSKMDTFYKNFKFGLVMIFIGFLCGVGFTMCNGCGGEELLPVTVDAGEDVLVEDALPPVPDLLPTKIDPIQACYDIVDWLCNKMSECTSDKNSIDDFAKVLLSSWNCPTTTGLRDSIEFYVQCQVDIKNMSCVEFQKADVPLSCQGQLL